MANTPLHWADWVIFALTLVISAGIGIFFALTGGRQKTTKEYLIGNRQLRVLPVALSMFMSYISAIYILGTVAEVYLHGIQIFLGQIGQMSGFFISAVIFVPTFYRLQLVSVYEYLDKRFNSRAVRLTCVCLQLLSMMVYMGIAMYAPSTALEGVTGFPVWASLIIMFLVTVFYSTIGGLKAVVWTDAFQGIVMFSGIIAILILGVIKVGGVAKVWNISREGGRHNWFNFNPDPTQRLNFWVLIGGRLFYAIIFGGVAQNNVQRYCALPSMTKAKLSVVMNGLMLLFVGVIMCSLGLVVYAYYSMIGCDPLRSRQISNQNQILPHFVVNVLRIPGLSGVFLAVLYSGALSSLSSSISAMSAITWKDILEKRFKKLPEARKALITKALVFVYGCLGVGIALVVRFLPGHVIQISSRVTGSISGPISGVMSLGCLVPFANAVGTGIGAIGGFLFTAWINVGANIVAPHRSHLYTKVLNCTLAANATVKPMPTNPPPGFPLYRLSFYLTPPMAVVSTVTIGIIISLITGGEKPERRNPRYIVPLYRYFCCCCPGPVRRFLSCGMEDFQEQQEESELRSTEMTSSEKMNGSTVGSTDGLVRNRVPDAKDSSHISTVSNGTVFPEDSNAFKAAWRSDLPKVVPKDGVLLSYKELKTAL